MTDLQSTITRLRQADEQHPDFWGTIRDRDADPQMVRDVMAVARAYARKETPSHEALRAIIALADFEYTNAKYAGSALAHIANKAAEGLGE